jgi:hypothetical protein
MGVWIGMAAGFYLERGKLAAMRIFVTAPTAALVLCLGAGSAVAAAEPPSLAGTWIPDPAASTHSKELKQAVQPGAPPAPPAPSAAIRDQLPTLRITQSEPRLTIEYLNPDGSAISTGEMTTDGKLSATTRPGETLLRKSVSTWDGNVLRTMWTLEQNGAVVISGVDRRELTAADTLVVMTTTEDSKSRSKSVIVYHRGK